MPVGNPVWNRKCGMTLIGRDDKPRDGSVNYRRIPKATNFLRLRPPIYD